MPGFDINVIPPENRNSKQIAAHIEMYREAMNTWRVHNPTEEDFIVYNDRMVSNESWTIPNKNRDIGMGKGNFDVPYYIARRYVQRMGERIISKISRDDWEKRKLQYRQDEWGEKEERMAIKTNDKKEWDKLIPQLLLGIVKRYQGDNIYEAPAKEPEKRYDSPVEEAIARLGIKDKDLGTEEAAPLMNEGEKQKQDLINSLT